MKYINIKRFKFSTILKNLNTIVNNFLKIFNFIDFKKYDVRKISKYLDIKRLDFTLVSKYFNLRTYNFGSIRKVKFLNSKFLLFHLPASIVFFGLLYLIIPSFYNYEKSRFEKVICNNQKIKCSIKGDVSYSFYPTPRIKIKNLIVNDLLEKKKDIIKVENATIKLSFKNLLAKEKHKYKTILLNQYEINLDLKKIKKYKNFFKKTTNLKPIFFTKGQIIFFNGDDYVATINNADINIEFLKHSIDTILKGKFLGDDLYISLNSKKDENKMFTDIILKMSHINFLTKANITHSGGDKNITSGNILIKKDKNRITAVFDYKDNELLIKKSNVRNAFLDGKLEGKINFLPYFDFDLDLNLASLNFTKLYNYFLSLDKDSQKKLFNINNKINGKLNFSSDKIYSSYNLSKSFESRIKFYNGNISIEQFLLNFGKLGAADILGTVQNDEKFTNFKFESNIFIDNKKKFLSKFGVYNRKNIHSNLFISGNFDLKNIRISFYEISNGEKNNTEHINFIEEEFNDLILENGYEKLFHFPTFKEFIKSITSENN